MALPIFNPPDAPSFSSVISDDPRSETIDLQAGYEQVVPLGIRPVHRANLRWNISSEDNKDYIESFFHTYLRTAFEWKPFDKVASPSGTSGVLSQVAGGSLGARTYFILFTWFDTVDGETKESAQSTLAVSANFFLKVTVPPIPTNVEGFRVYGSETSGSEVLQATITDGTQSWTQAGAFGAGASAPTTNNLNPNYKWIMNSLVTKPRTSALLWNINLTFIEQIV